MSKELIAEMNRKLVPEIPGEVTFEIAKYRQEYEEIRLKTQQNLESSVYLMTAGQILDAGDAIGEACKIYAAANAPDEQGFLNAHGMDTAISVMFHANSIIDFHKARCESVQMEVNG